MVLGAIASATAPAATLRVVKQYKAKGPLTDILLPVVALDDAVGLMIFAILFGIAKALISGKVDILSVVVEPILEVALAPPRSYYGSCLHVRRKIFPFEFKENGTFRYLRNAYGGTFHDKV